MKKVKVIESIKDIVEVLEVTEDTQDTVLVEENELVSGKKCIEKVIRENDKLYFVVQLEEHATETGEESNVYKKQLIKAGDFLFKDENLYTGEVRYTLLIQGRGASTISEAIKYLMEANTDEKRAKKGSKEK